ncbi:hypothetical protein JRO89_XS10G0083700 [Xanthoceras sorbifolium]|uniref:Uncharacterized protein n=1 Tax=Xanthoceras sorbifolium TaxID=99658 RepID=A0ABQ8HI38_9ROSI|nr:hypothetical protein JRO89_XS10G0083700 [Xanthoceras sorbifolium]
MPLQRHEVQSSNTDFNELYAEEENLIIMHGSDYQDTKSHKQMKQKSSRLNYSNPSPANNSYPDMHEDCDGETPVTDSYCGSRLKSKHDAEGTRLESILHHHDLYGGKITSEKTKLLLHDYDNVSPKIVQHSEYLSKLSNITLGSNKSLAAEKRGRSKRMKKVEKLHKERKVIKGQHDPLRVMMHPANKITVAKQVRSEFPQRDYMAEPSYAEIPLWTNQTKGLTDYFSPPLSRYFAIDSLGKVNALYLLGICRVASVRMKLQKLVHPRIEELPVDGWKEC